MQAEADLIAGRAATLFAFERLSAVAYTALAEWPRTRAGQREVCSVELIAERLPSRSLPIRTRGFACEAAPAE